MGPVNGLANLLALDLEHNKIGVITGVANLAKLAYLYLSNNQIEDIAALVASSGLNSGSFVWLQDNLLDKNCNPDNGDTTDCDNVQILKDRGVNVSW